MIFLFLEKTAKQNRWKVGAKLRPFFYFFLPLFVVLIWVGGSSVAFKIKVAEWTPINERGLSPPSTQKWVWQKHNSLGNLGCLSPAWRDPYKSSSAAALKKLLRTCLTVNVTTSGHSRTWTLSTTTTTTTTVVRLFNLARENWLWRKK